MAQLVCGLPIAQGLPFPSQEANAIDVVVRYAVTELGFPFEDIILYAWSIGKYTQGPQHTQVETGSVSVRTTFKSGTGMHICIDNVFCNV